MDVALARWLPAAGGDGDARRAAMLLGTLLDRVHLDRWLSEALQESIAHPGSWLGFTYLQRAIERNAAGDPRQALRWARLAQARFSAAPNRPGWVRAKLEEVYALHRRVDGRACLAGSVTLEESLRGHSYVWVEIQAALEMSVCATMLGDFAAARPPLHHAQDLAQRGYENLNLRAIGLEAALETVTGNAVAAWSMDRSGLARYFNGRYAPQRGYQFYSDLSFVAQNFEYWHLATVIAAEAEQMIAATSNQSMKSMAAYRYAMLASRAGFDSDAAEGYKRASGQFSVLPQDDTTQIYRTEGQVSLALIETNRGQFSAALEHLRTAQISIPVIKDVTVLLRYYQALGVVWLHEGRVDEAETAFRKATAIAELGFSSRRTRSERASWTAETRNAYLGLTELLLRRRNSPTEALRAWAEYRAGTLRPGMKLGVPSHRPRGLIAAVPLSSPREAPAVLTYAVFSDGVAVWLFDGRRLVSHWSNLREQDLQTVSERFAAECADRASPPSALERDGRWLYERLIQPVEGTLTRGQPILLEPDGPISRIPFAALPASNQRFFGADHPITVSLGLAPVIVDEGVTVQSRALVVGAPALSANWTPSFPPLPDAVREARAVADLFPRSTLLLSAGASYSAVRDGLADTEVFHFAGHAVSDGSGGALLLADPSGAAPLSAAIIETMTIRHCRLAVLSACSTGIGEGAVHTEGLAGAFLRAGVRRVVATRWRVDSNAARIYTELLYGHLLSGIPLQQAMYQAAATLRERPATAHPCYWAAFEAYEAASPWARIAGVKGN